MEKTSWAECKVQGKEDAGGNPAQESSRGRLSQATERHLGGAVTPGEPASLRSTAAPPGSTFQDESGSDVGLLWALRWFFTRAASPFGVITGE